MAFKGVVKQKCVHRICPAQENQRKRLQDNLYKDNPKKKLKLKATNTESKMANENSLTIERSKELSKSGYAWIFQCKICPAYTCNIHFMTKHITKHHKKKIFNLSSDHNELECSWIFKCTMCLNVFPTVPIMNEHIQYFHRIENLESCEICSIYFKDKQTLSVHVKANHEKSKINQCSFCFSSFLTQDELNAHIELHKKFRSFPISPEFATKYGFNIDNMAQEGHEESDIIEENIANDTIKQNQDKVTLDIQNSMTKLVELT